MIQRKARVRRFADTRKGFYRYAIEDGNGNVWHNYTVAPCKRTDAQRIVNALNEEK